MEKILLVMDAEQLNEPAVDFACYLGRLTHSKITGVFLENLVADQKVVLKSLYGSPVVDWEIDEESPEYRNKRNLIQKNIHLFKEACEKRSVHCNIHCDEGTPAKEIVTESRYADLIIVDPATSFNKRFEGTPTEFVKDILKDAECPVIIAPESFESLDEIIFTWDGTKSAAFAIKQFSYLFPQLEDKRIILLQVNEKGEWKETDRYKLTEWLQNRYSAVGFQALKGDTDDCLFDYLFKKEK